MGEDLKRDQPIKFGFCRDISEVHDDEDLLFVDYLVYSESKVAPVYPGPDVKVSCKLRSDLSRVNKKLFEKRTGIDGKPYLRVKYTLSLSTDAANMRFSLEFDGTEIGSVEASYT